MPLIFTMWLSSSISRGVGDATTPLYALGLATVFIRGWLGLPQLAVASAAVASLIAFAIALSWLAWYWRRKNHPLAPNAALASHLKPDPAILRKILQIGLPSCMQLLTMAAAEMVLLGLVNRHGSNATAAYGAVNQVMRCLQLPAMSLGITSMILSSHAIGAGRAHQLGVITRTGLILNLLITGTFVLLAYLLAPWITGWFLTDASVVSMAIALLHIVAWSVVLLGLANVLTGVMRASGTVLRPMALNMGVILLLELPVAYTLDQRWGLQGIWWAYALAFNAILIVQGSFYRRAWRHQSINKLI